MSALVVLFFTRIPESLDPGDLENYTRTFPVFLRERARAYRSLRRRMEFLVGRQLLTAGLERLGAACSLDQLEYSPEGRPFLRSGPFFSISHTRGLVACALSGSGMIGLDVEIRRELDVEDFRPWLATAELEAVRASEDPVPELLRRWTAMEALYKASGEEKGDEVPGESGGPGRVRVAGIDWHVYPVRFGEGYYASLVSAEELSGVSPEYIPGVYP